MKLNQIIILLILTAFLLLMCLCSPPKYGTYSVESNAEAKTFSCSDSEQELIDKGVTHVKNGDGIVYIGYRQLGENKDPITAKFTSGNQDWCKTDYEVSNDDSTGYGLLWYDDYLYGIFTSTGTQGSVNEDFREFAGSGWLSSYGAGGGAKISVIARIDIETGEPQYATFVSAVLSSGNSNSLLVKDIYSNGTNLVVECDSWWSPRSADKKGMSCPDGTKTPIHYRLEFDYDLSTVYEASAPPCSTQ